MARLTAATYGFLALIAQLALGLIQRWDAEKVLAQTILALLIASCLGWIVGNLALLLALGTPRGAFSASNEQRLGNLDK
jgi:hypothetical protein